MYIRILICIFLLLLTRTVQADSLVCGSEWITDGSVNKYTKEKIEKLCGKPASIKDWEQNENVTGYNATLGTTVVTNTITVHYSKWIYKKSGQPTVDLLFIDGKLVKLKEGF